MFPESSDPHFDMPSQEQSGDRDGTEAPRRALHHILEHYGITGAAAEEIIGFNYTRVEAERRHAEARPMHRARNVDQYMLDDNWNAYTEKGPFGEVEVTITSAMRIPGASITISEHAARKLAGIVDKDPEEDPF